MELRKDKINKSKIPLFFLKFCPIQRRIELTKTVFESRLSSDFINGFRLVSTKSNYAERNNQSENLLFNLITLRDLLNCQPSFKHFVAVENLLYVSFQFDLISEFYSVERYFWTLTHTVSGTSDIKIREPCSLLWWLKTSLELWRLLGEYTPCNPCVQLHHWF